MIVTIPLLIVSLVLLTESPSQIVSVQPDISMKVLPIVPLVQLLALPVPLLITVLLVLTITTYTTTSVYAPVQPDTGLMPPPTLVNHVTIHVKLVPELTLTNVTLVMPQDISTNTNV